MGVIADMIRAGVDPEMVERVAMEMVETARHGIPARSSAAIRQQRYRDRLKASAEGVTNVTNVTRDVTRDASPLSPPPPKNTNQTPSTPIPQPKARAKARTALGGEAQPTDADRKAAEAAGLSPVEFRDEWRAFRDHHVSRGTLMADWQAAWRTWLRNRKKFAPTPRAGSPPRRPTIHDRLAQFNDPDEAHDEPTHDGPTIDGSLAPGADEPGGCYTARGAVEPSGAHTGWPLAATGYAGRLV